MCGLRIIKKKCDDSPNTTKALPTSPAIPMTPKSRKTVCETTRSSSSSNAYSSSVLLSLSKSEFEVEFLHAPLHILIANRDSFISMISLSFSLSLVSFFLMLSFMLRRFVSSFYNYVFFFLLFFPFWS